MEGFLVLLIAPAQAAEQLLALSHPTGISKEGWPGTVAGVHTAWWSPGLPCLHTPEPAQEDIPTSRPREVPGPAGNR